MEAAAYSERKYFARCLTSFSSDTLCAFLDFIRQVDPQTFSVRHGGESFHIDFNALSDETYAQVRDFIQRQLPVDPAVNEQQAQQQEDGKPDLLDTQNKTSKRFLNGVRRFRVGEDQVFSLEGFPIKLVGTSTATERPYTCLTCNATFVSKNKCVDHIRYIHLKTYQVECDVCHAKLKNKHYLKEHKQRKHSTFVPATETPVKPSVSSSTSPVVVVPSPEVCRCKTGCGKRCGCLRSGKKCGENCLCVSCTNRDDVAASA